MNRVILLAVLFSVACQQQSARLEERIDYAGAELNSGRSTCGANANLAALDGARTASLCTCASLGRVEFLALGGASVAEAGANGADPIDEIRPSAEQLNAGTTHALDSVPRYGMYGDDRS